MKWNPVYETNNDNIGIAFHAACLVLIPDRREVGLYKMTSELLELEKNSRIKIEGLYIFGGRNAFGKAVDTLKILKIGSVFPFILH